MKLRECTRDCKNTRAENMRSKHTDTRNKMCPENTGDTGNRQTKNKGCDSRDLYQMLNRCTQKNDRKETKTGSGKSEDTRGGTN